MRNSRTSPAEAAQELLRRRAARNRLLPFCRYTKRDYLTAPHLEQLAEELERVERGETTRLMVFEPPRHGKSELVSVRFPTWCLGRHPEWKIVQTGYAHDIAATHSRNARAVFTSDPYVRLFPDVHETTEDRQKKKVRVAAQKQAAHEWGTVQRGSYYAVGVGGPLTGKGADIAIIDDPVKDRAEANSDTKRKNVLDWYRSTLRTRIEPGGRIILVMTRWHPDDLAGTLLKEMRESTGEQWRVISLPAIDDDGNALWPERYNVERLRQIEKAIGRYEFNSLYQQRPTIRGGNILKADDQHVKIHDTTDGFPKTQYRRAWDLASSAKQRNSDDPDYTWGSLGTVTYEKDPATGQSLPHLWIAHAVSFRKEGPERNRIIVQTAMSDAPGTKQLVETYGAYKDAAAELTNILKGIRTVTRMQLPGDKLAKASPLEPIFEAGNVHIARGPWNEEWMQQHVEFTGIDGATHDDAVDCSAMIYHDTRRPTGGLAMPGNEPTGTDLSILANR